MHLGIVARAHSHQRLKMDGAGQHEAVVVVGVLADQVDATGARALTRVVQLERAGESLANSLLESCS